MCYAAVLLHDGAFAEQHSLTASSSLRTPFCRMKLFSAAGSAGHGTAQHSTAQQQRSYIAMCVMSADSG
jgi:hypothetical protein